MAYVNRIPKKGTPEYRAYWRDRALIDDLKIVRDKLAYIAGMSESARKVLYQQGLTQVDEAIKTFKLGWQLPYIDEDPK